MFEMLIASSSPLPACPSASPTGIATAHATPIAAPLTFRCSQVNSSTSARPPTCTPPVWASRVWKMKSNASAKSRQEAEREVQHHAGCALRHGVSRRCTVEQHHVERERQQHRQPAGRDHARLERDVAAGRRSARRARRRPANTASVARPTVVVVAIRRPAMMSGTASGSSTRHSSCRSVSPMPRPASRRVRRDVVEARDDVAEDDLERVGGERDQRRGRAAAGDRQQQEEHGQARQRVEDSRDPDDRADQPPPPARQQRQREGDREAASRPRSTVRYDVLGERVRVAVEVVDDPARAEARSARCSCRRCARGSRPGPARRRPASIGQAWRAAAGRCVCSVALGELRKCGDDLDRQHADHAPRSSTTGPYWVSDWSRSESASRST